MTYVIVPWNSSVKTNVIGLIKALVSKFPPGSKLRKLFNAKNVCYSYCVAKNMGHHIQGHNSMLLGQSNAVTLGPCAEKPCKEARQGQPCWEASAHCNARDVVYGGEVTYEDATGQKVDFRGKAKRVYTGCTVNLKKRVAEHRTSFNPSTKPSRKGKSVQQLNDEKRKRSTLAAHVWDARANGVSPVVKWFIQERARVYRPGDEYCGLCLGETVLICFGDPATSLNKRTELRQGCRHRWRHKLINHQ